MDHNAYDYATGARAVRNKPPNKQYIRIHRSYNAPEGDETDNERIMGSETNDGVKEQQDQSKSTRQRVAREKANRTGRWRAHCCEAGGDR